MRTETPGRLSSRGLLIAPLTAGELAWEVSSALLVCGVAAAGWAIRDLIVGPTKR